MKNFLEIHVLQNFPASCLNRDQGNVQKKCFFGDSQRDRVSSQCWKNAMRGYWQEKNTFNNGLGIRTKFLVDSLAKKVSGQVNEESSVVSKVCDAIASCVFSSRKDNTLVFYSVSEYNVLLKIIVDNFDNIKKELVDKSEKKNKTDDKVSEVILDLVKDFKNAPTVDMSLFGRMVAGHNDQNIEAASQMSHIFSTNISNNESDFWTAVDALKEEFNPGDNGSAHLGDQSFASPCFYRYINVSLQDLDTSLKDRANLKEIIPGFIEAFINSLPTGKQNSFAAHTLPSYVRIINHNGSALNLCNAFIRPVRSNNGQFDIVNESIKSLEGHKAEIDIMYGLRKDEASFTCSLSSGKSLEEVIQLAIDDILGN